jgi:hypothetical protein
MSLHGHHGGHENADREGSATRGGFGSRRRCSMKRIFLKKLSSTPKLAAWSTPIIATRATFLVRTASDEWSFGSNRSVISAAEVAPEMAWSHSASSSETFTKCFRKNLPVSCLTLKAMPDPVGHWYQDGDWWVRHDRTTKSFARLRTDAIKALQWGLSALFSKPEWRDSRTLRITTGLGPALFNIAEGFVFMEEGRITCKVRFKWPFLSVVLKDKTLSDVGTMAVEVAGTPLYSREVFIVHGHSDTARTQLKNLLSALGLEPIILSEQTHRGRTIIEELEHHSVTSSFAFVLMTPDDIGPDREGKSLRRARQNVVLELGWFMGRLGRDSVILISQGDIELPSDILGVLYLQFKTDVHEVAAEISKQLRDVGML